MPEPGDGREAGGADAFLTIRGRRLHYVDWGNRAAPPLLLLHGLQDCARLWDFFAPRFTAAYHVVALDHRGHGDSQWTADGLYHLEDYVGEVAEFIEALELQDPVVLGHSAGGKNAFVYASRPDARLSRLVIVDMDPDADNPGSKAMIGRYKSEDDEWPDLMAVADRLRSREPNASIEVLRHHAEVLTKPIERGRRVWKRDRNVVLTYERPDAWGYLDGVRVPTLITRGVDSTLLTHDVAVRMQERIPDCRLVELEGGGHWAHDENPEQFEAAVRAFLAERAGE